jgi:pimeloyl-ACP methyl ester carboxylesterase
MGNCTMRIRFPTASTPDSPWARTVRVAGRGAGNRDAGERDVGVYEYGDPDGSPVFALHGTPACGAGFDWTDAPARDRGLRIIAPDRPGIGRSTRVAMAAVADYAPELDLLADALELERFTVLGYSGGGPYALAAAAALGDRVRSVTIVAGAGEIGAWATFADLARSDRQLTWLALHAPVVARATLRTADLGSRIAPRIALWSARTEMIESDRAALRELGSPRHALALFTQALAHSSAGVVDDYALLAKRWNVELDQITAPVHCWHGTADTLVPLAHTEALIARLPHAQLTTWPGEGHLALIAHVRDVLDDIAASVR